VSSVEGVRVTVGVDGTNFGSGRAVPGTFLDAHHAAGEVVRHMGACQQLAAVVKHPHQVAMGNAACPGIGRAQKHRLAALDGVGGT